MENAALLARVSTKGQEDNSSPEAQLKRGREYSKSKGYNIVAERVEVMSGSYVLARSTYNELLNMAADRQISVIVADRPDRLGRGDAIAKLELLAQLNGARVEYAQPGRDTSTIDGLVQHSAEQMVSGIERLNIRRRTRAGKYDWAQRGRIIATAHRPFGFEFINERDSRGRKISCQLAVVPVEAQLVKRIYTMCAEECMTTRQIGHQLNNEGIHAPGGKWWRWRTIHKILTSETYKGVWRYGKVEVKRNDNWGRVTFTVKRREPSETVTVPCPAIVNESLWDMVQEQLKLNHARFKKPTLHKYLLRGRLHCACGRTMAGEFLVSQRGNEVGSRGQMGFRYYGCTRKPCEDNASCGAKRLRADGIEHIVWDIVSSELQDIDRLIDMVKQERDKDGEARRHIEQTITVTQQQIDKAQNRLRRYRKLYGDGNLTEHEYLLEKCEIDSETAKLHTEMQELVLHLNSTAELTPTFEDELRNFQMAIQDRLTPTTPIEAQLKIYEMLRIECDYRSETSELTVKGLIGSRTVCLKSTSAPIRGWRKFSPVTSL